MVHLDNVDLEVISDHSRVMELGLVDGSEIAVNYQMSFAQKAYEEDVYSTTGSLRTYTDRAVHVGQVLSTDYNMFDCLLTLCELCKDLFPLLRDLWQLLMLMLIPNKQTCCSNQWSGCVWIKSPKRSGDPPPTVSSTRRGPRSCRAHRPRRGPPICCSADHR